MYTYMKKDTDSKKHKNSGIPDHMKTYVENLSGFSFDDVRVHYNSDQPRRFQALGYTQGNNVHLRPGQENHLMHELWHVVQQKKGIVKPTSSIGGYALNDSAELEKEAEDREKQYEREAPLQMLREIAARRSETMGKDGLKGNPLRYHVVGQYQIDGGEKDAVWSNSEYWMGKGEGDHAEDAICDEIELLAEFFKVDLTNRELRIWLSSSPCERCQERLNELQTRYGLRIFVEAAKEYKGVKGGGAGQGGLYSQEIMQGVEKGKLLQL